MTLSFNYGIPGAYTNFIPQISAKLQSDFSHSQKYPLSRYSEYIYPEKPLFQVVRHDPQPEATIGAAKNFQWLDGARPQVNFTTRNTFQAFACQRYADTFVVGDVAQETTQPVWNLIADSAVKATRNLMVNRTYQGFEVLTNTANWPTGNYGAVTAIPFQEGFCETWDLATLTTPYIQASLQYATIQIELQTNSSVSYPDLRLVVDSSTAAAMAQTDEIKNYWKNSVYALPAMEGTNPNWAYGLPPYLWGIEVCVDNTVGSTSVMGTTPNYSYILGNNAFLLQKPGNPSGSLNTLNSLGCALYKDLSVLLKHDAQALLTDGTVYDYYTFVPTFYTAYWFQNPIG